MLTDKPHTHVKSFFAASVQAAMEQARQEMGSEALLLDTRDAPPEARHLGDFEVIFGSRIEPPPQPSAAPRPAAAPATLDDLRRHMEEIRGMLEHVTPSSGWHRSHNNVVAQSLIEAGVERALAGEIEETVRQKIARRPVRIEDARPAAGDPAVLLRAAREEISSRIAVAPEIGRIAALVGPPGAGKTTTLVKLAVARGLAAHRNVHLISTDTHRIGGAAQLRTYAGILGVPFQAVETPGELERALDGIPAGTQVLIDTPGYSAVLLQDLGTDLARFLAARQDIDTHLVLTASMRVEDLYHTAELYEAFRPAKLLFTHMDETTSLASVFCVAARRARPVSFLCAGQSIPEDLAPAAVESITESLVRQLPSDLAAVA